jgi:hypothetical protein
MAELVSARLALATDRIRSELGWRPRHAGVTDGLRAVLQRSERAA